jgi:hypothetical protein
MKLLCTKCGDEKDISNFRKDQHNPTGYHCHCNTCYNLNQRIYYNNNLDKVRNYAKEYYKKNAKRISELRQARKKGESTQKLFKTTLEQRESSIKSYYNREGWKKTRESGWRSRGIKNFTYLQFEEMVVKQNNKCYICGSGPDKNHSLYVDHDHKTGKVRKLLCNNCNNGIVKLKDDVELLQKAVNYLKEH